MTKEQEEAIKYLKESVLIYKNTIPKMSNTIDTVLSLIKAQQEEISKYKTLYERALSDVVYADKIKDLMAEQLAGLTIWNSKKEEPLILKDKEEVKQYFEQKVKSSKQ